MKKGRHDGLRREYERRDLGRGVRGRYYDSYLRGTNVVLLLPDVARVFPDEVAVNEALRSLIKLARQSAGHARTGNGPGKRGRAA